MPRIYETMLDVLRMLRPVLLQIERHDTPRSRRNVNGQVNEHDEVVHEPEPVKGDEQESRRTVESCYVMAAQARSANRRNSMAQR